MQLIVAVDVLQTSLIDPSVSPSEKTYSTCAYELLVSIQNVISADKGME